MRVALAVVVATGCGDNRLVADAPPAPLRDAVGDVATDTPIDAFVIDGLPGVPDMQLVASEMVDTVVVTRDNFTAADCEVVEGCIGGPGVRTLLRFDAVVANLGEGDVVFGAPPPPGVSNGTFIWSACHMHHHVANWASYELRDATGIVIAGHKQAFCLEDTEQVLPGASSRGFTCGFQGISVGWADVYTRYLPCQWVDVTDVPHGSYTLHVVVNPLQVYSESDYTNDDVSIEVQL